MNARRTNAFTIIELMVVVVIISLLTAVALPAFNNMLRSNNASLAGNKLATAVEAARDAAARGGEGEDAAAVFFYDAGRIRIVPCVRVGTMSDRFSGEDRSSPLVSRDVFVPTPLVEPVELPAGWMVRGRAPGGWTSGAWYEQNYFLNGTTSQNEANWVFPETGFYDSGRNDEGERRQTFMVRFEGGSGRHAIDNGAEAVALDLRPSQEDRTSLRVRLDKAPDLDTAVRRAMMNPDLLQHDRLSDLLGNRSSDSVLVKPVAQLALYEERALAGAIGAKIDRVTGSIYTDPEDPQLGPSIDVGDINSWIDGTLPGYERETRLFRVSRFSGRLVEMTGEGP